MKTIKSYMCITFIARQMFRVKRLFWFFIAMAVRAVTKVNGRMVFCWSFDATKYACNPRAITEYILDTAPDDYEIYWGFNKDVDISALDTRIHVVRRYGMAYLRALYTSRFIIYNMRNAPLSSMFIKKRGQKYIMTWHGNSVMKHVEKDAAACLSKRHIWFAKRDIWFSKCDSAMCDLMLSNSRWFTSLIRTSFWYGGEILEGCCPRNDIFYDERKRERAYRTVRQSLGFDPDIKIVLYAPTFRDNSLDLKYYRIDWDALLPLFEEKLGGKVEVLVRLHPNMANAVDVRSLVDMPYLHDVSREHDATECYFAADALVTDYSSTIFDFALLRRPCFIYATDRHEYERERGLYWKLEQLPFPLAENIEDFRHNIGNFDKVEYVKKLDMFFSDVLGLEEYGRGSERVLKWMDANR